MRQTSIFGLMASLPHPDAVNRVCERLLCMLSSVTARVRAARVTPTVEISVEETRLAKKRRRTPGVTVSLGGDRQSLSEIDGHVDHIALSPATMPGTRPETKADAVGTSPPVMIDNTEDADKDSTPCRSRRGLAYTFGTLLILVGALIPTIAVGASLWNNHRQSEERVQFLKRVNTPSPVTGAQAPIPVTFSPSATRVPSTVSGALVPNNARTPTANIETRAAQPIATTQAPNRQIVAGLPPPAPSATPVVNSSMDVSATPELQPAPAQVSEPKKMPAPTHLTIPAIKVDSDIVAVGVSPIDIDGQQAYIWDVAPYAVGHHFSSADPGEGENVVLSGHDDWQGEVFKNLWKVKQGDQIVLKAGNKDWHYHVDQILDFSEVGQPLDKRLENAAFIGTTGDERLTLVTCYPYGVDSDRIIIIARPDWCSQC